MTDQNEWTLGDTKYADIDKDGNVHRPEPDPEHPFRVYGTYHTPGLTREDMQTELLLQIKRAMQKLSKTPPKQTASERVRERLKKRKGM